MDMIIIIGGGPSEMGMGMFLKQSEIEDFLF